MSDTNDINVLRRERDESIREAVALQKEQARLLKFLKRCGTGYRIVASGDLTELQIAEAQARDRFYVEPGGGLGWALLPWSLSTAYDRQRERESKT